MPSLVGGVYGRPMKLALAAVLLVLVAGCGGTDKPEAKSTPTPSAKVAAVPTDDASPTDDLNVDMTQREQIYIKLVKEGHYRPLAGAENERLLAVGRAICGLVPVDATTQQKLFALKSLLDNGFKARAAGEMMGLASALCPEKQAALTITE